MSKTTNKYIKSFVVIMTITAMTVTIFNGCSNNRSIKKKESSFSSPQSTANIYSKAILNKDYKLAFKCWKFDSKSSYLQDISGFNLGTKGLIKENITDMPEKIDIKDLKYFKSINKNNRMPIQPTSLKEANLATVNMFCFLKKNYNSKLPVEVPRKITKENVIVLYKLVLKKFGSKWKFSSIISWGPDVDDEDYKDAFSKY